MSSVCRLVEIEIYQFTYSPHRWSYIKINLYPPKAKNNLPSKRKVTSLHFLPDEMKCYICEFQWFYLFSTRMWRNQIFSKSCGIDLFPENSMATAFIVSVGKSKEENKFVDQNFLCRRCKKYDYFWGIQPT